MDLTNDSAPLRAASHEREAERLAALDRYAVLDTPREQDFDDIAALASEICETPIAVVNLVTDRRQWFKAEVGLGVRETPLETSFCGHAILQDDFTIVPDATKDPRFDCNPLVTGQPGLRFYAGALLKTAEDLPIGTLCVLDYTPRELSVWQVRSLQRLARQVMAQMELRRALRLQQFLTNELQHRVKNTLTMVQAIANQTFRGESREARDAFTARLVALGKAHDILTQQSWVAATMRQVVEGALLAHRTGEGRFDIGGPDLRLAPKAALALALAIHELATNATKYGALSTQAGRVAIRWSVDAGRLHFHWKESGGPPVAPPTRKGFGSRLVERSLAGEFGGTVRFGYEPSGITCDLDASLDALEPVGDRDT